MRYELHVRNGGKKAISFREGDEFVVDLYGGELCFFRDDYPLNVVHAGFPYGTGSSKIHIKFQWKKEHAMIVQEVEELARIISSLTWFCVERVSPEGCTKIRYRFTQGDGSCIKVDYKDQLVIDTLYGGITLKKSGALYAEGSPLVEVIELGSLYSFLDDEVFYMMQLISALSRVELIYSNWTRGVITYHCDKHISYADCYDENNVVVPFCRKSAA